MRRLLAISAVAGALLFAPNAFAAKQDFTLVNKTGYQIDSVFVSATRSNSWEEDVMGQDTLGDGDAVDISFEKGSRGCHYDLMVKYHDGDQSEWHGLDLCSITKVQLFWDRKEGTTRATTE